MSKLADGLIMVVLCFSDIQDYENRIQCLQEQVERHSMISSVATTHMFDEEEEEEGTGAELWEVKWVQGKVSVENVLGQNYGKLSGFRGK